MSLRVVHYLNQFFAGIDQTFSDGSSRYDSLQVIGTKRYARSYTMQVAYTLSKSMDDCAQYPPSAQAGRTCVQNPFRPISDEWARASFDRRHVVRINGIWDLPQMENRPLRHVLISPSDRGKSPTLTEGSGGLRRSAVGLESESPAKGGTFDPMRAWRTDVRCGDVRRDDSRALVSASLGGRWCASHPITRVGCFRTELSSPAMTNGKTPI